MKTSKITKMILLSLGLIFVVSYAQAAVKNVPADFDSIQAAIDAASSGDVVCVAPGTYRENVDMKDGVDLIGAGADDTIIDGGGNGDVVNASVNNATISGFTLQNGTGTDPGLPAHYSAGLYVTGSHAPVVRNNIIASNRFGMRLMDGASPDVRNNLIVDNSVDGIYVFGSTISPTNPSIINNTIVSNGRDGILLRNTVSPIIKNNIVANHSSGSGIELNVV